MFAIGSYVWPSTLRETSMTTIPDVPGGSSRDGVSSEPRASSTAATTRPTSTAASAARKRRVRRAYGASAPMSADGTAGTGRRKRLRGTTTPILAGEANVPLEAQDRLGRRRRPPSRRARELRARVPLPPALEAPSQAARAHVGALSRRPECVRVRGLPAHARSAAAARATLPRTATPATAAPGRRERMQVGRAGRQRGGAPR